MKQAKVFLDTSVVKHAIRSRTVMRPWRHGREAGTGTAQGIVSEDPARRVSGRLRLEIDCLSEVTRLAEEGILELLWHFETFAEFARIFMIPGAASDFSRAGIRMVRGPFDYGRPLVPLYPPGPTDASAVREEQVRFLKSLDHVRFLQLQRACGAAQGQVTNDNQLIDAFHIWCAEHEGAHYFLTTDLKLIRLITNHRTYPPRVRVLAPSELLDDIRGDSDPS